MNIKKFTELVSRKSRTYGILSFVMIVVLVGVIFSNNLFFAHSVRADGGFETNLITPNSPGVAQVVSFAPLSITTGETFRIYINYTGYGVTASGGDTVATIVSGLASALSPETAVSCTTSSTAVTCTSTTPGTAFVYGTLVVPASSFVTATTTPARQSSAQALLVVQGTPNYVFIDSGTGPVLMKHTGTPVNGNPTYEQDLNGDGTYGDAISQITHTVLTTGVSSGSTVQSVTQITIDTPFTNGNTLGLDNCTVHFSDTDSEDLDCSDNSATINTTTNSTATQQADRLIFLTGLTNYSVDDDGAGSNAIFLLTHTGTPASGNPSEGTGIADPNSHVTVVGDGTGASVVGIGAAQSIDSFSFTGDIPSGAKIRLYGSLVVTFTNTTSDIDASDNTAALSRFQAGIAKVVTYTPSSVTAGETFLALNNFQTFLYTAGSGDTAATVTAALSPFIQSVGNVTCSEDGVKITCTATVAGVDFNAGAIVQVAPFVTSMISDAPSNTLTDTSALNFTVGYSELVTGVDTSDFNLVTTGDVSYSGYTVTRNSDHQHYVVAVSGVTGNGTIKLQALDDNTIADENTNIPLGGNSLSAPVDGPVVTVVTSAPVVRHSNGHPPFATNNGSGGGANTSTVPSTTQGTVANVSGCTASGVGLLTADALFDRDLHFADHGKDVVELQDFLEETGLLVVPADNIKGLFGLLTQDALKKYQAVACITEDGLGPITRAHLATTTTVITNTPVVQPVAATSNTGRFTTPLYEGVDNSSDVTALQQFLAKQGTDIYPEATVSGVFDAPTKVAVENFQTKYNLCTTTDIAYGYVGPATRAKINSMLAAQ